jgi:hypothetical protein
MATPFRLIAGMATMPSRRETAPVALRSLAGQFDRLHLTLNGFDDIPSWATGAQIDAHLAGTGVDYGASGKLRGLLHEAEDDRTVYFCVDDDIRYPPDFVARLVRALSDRPDDIVGVHGSVFRRPFRSWKSDRNVHYFQHPLLRGKPVDVVATCGCAFFPSRLKLDVEHWPPRYRNCVDLSLAIEAARQGVGAWVVARGWRWMKALETRQADSIYAGLRHNDELHTRLSLELQSIRNGG